MQLIETRTGLKGRARYRDRAWTKVIASKPREGRVMRACRRALIAAGAVKTRTLLEWAYPHLKQFECWHYKSVYRAVKRYAVKDGRVWVPRI